MNITVTSEANEVLTWRMLARQTVPMLTRPEQFHISQRKQLAQTICLLLSGDLELEHVFGNAEENYEPGGGDKDGHDASRRERWRCE